MRQTITFIAVAFLSVGAFSSNPFPLDTGIVVTITPVGTYCESDPAVNLQATPPGGTWGGAANQFGQFLPPSSGPGNHVVTYDYDDGNGCTGSDQITITVYANPTVMIDPAGPFCDNDPVYQLIGTPTGGTWSGAANSLGQVDPVALGPGSHPVQYDYTDSNGCSGTGVINIPIFTTPVASITPAGPFCEDEPIQTLNASPTGGTWGGAANSLGQIDPATLGAGIHEVTYSFSNGNNCTDIDTINVQINGLPMVSIVQVGPFCDSDPLQILSSSPSGGTWGGAANASGEFDPSSVGAGNHNVTYSYTDGNGCTNADQITIVVNADPTVSINAAGPFCDNDPVQTLSASPTGGTWGGAANASGQIDPGTLGAGSHNVTYDYTDSNNCYNSDQITITIYTAPIVSINAAGPFCDNDPVQTLSASPAGGTWGGAANASGQIDPATLGTGAHTVTYDYTDSNNCSNSDQITVIINASPTVSITPAGPYCIDDPLQNLTVTPTGGTWGGAANASGQIDPAALGVGSHIVTYDYTDSNNCSNSDQITVVINAMPTVSITQVGPFCEDVGVQTLTASPTGGTWGGAANASGQIDPATLGAGSHTVTYDYTDSNNCSNSDQITVVIYALPTVSITQAGAFCEDAGVQTLTASPTGGTWGGAANASGQIDPATLGAGAHTVTYDYTDSNNCSNSDQITVVIYALPAVSITQVGPFCEDAGVQILTATPAGGSWGGAANASGQIDPATLGAGSHNITYDYTDSNNCSNSDQITVIVNALPIVSINPAGPFCVDDPVQTLIATPTGGTWGGVANASGQIDPTALGIGSHTVTYDYTDGNGCTNSDQITVVINAFPTVIITPAGPFCVDAPLQTLSASPPGGVWGGAANGAGQIDPAGLGIGSHMVTYDYTNGSSCSNSDTITIIINSLPTVSISPAGPFCEDDPTQTLTASPSGGTWGGVANSSGQIDPMALGSGSYTITYDYTDGNGCSNSDQITIVVNALPIVSITPAGPFCVSAPSQTLTASPSGGTWGGVANPSGQIDPVVLGIGSHTVTYDYTDGNGCANSDQISILIYGLPTVSISPAGPFCDNDPTQTLTATPPGGTWGGAANASGQIDPATLGSGTHTVTYDFTDDNGCMNSDQISIVINAAPTVSISPAGPFCDNDPTQTLTATPPGGTWSGAANASGQIDPTALGSGTHTVTYDYTDGNGCMNTDQISIVINASPIVSISPAGPFCEDDPIQTLTATPGGGTWGGAANPAGQIDPMTLGAGSFIVTYTFINGSGCFNTDQINIQIDAQPTVSISPAGPFCEDDPVQTLTGTPPGGTWGGAANSGGQIDPSILGSGSHTVTYTFTNAAGCTDSDQTTIVINPNPTVSISPAGPFCEDDAHQILTGSPPGGTWGGAANGSGQIDPMTLGPGSYSVTYSFTDSNGCSDSDQITVVINAGPIVSITPAGPFCEDDSPQTLSASPGGGTWGGAANAGGQIDPTSLGVGNHTVTYDYTDGNGCSNSDQFTVVITAAPTVSITPAGPFCEDDPQQTLSATPSGGAWGGAANASGQIDPVTLGIGTHIVTYNYTDPSGCSDSDQISIVINAAPSVSITPAGPFCSNDPTQTLVGTPSGGTWGGAANSGGTIDPNALGPGAHTVTYDYTDGNGCSASSSETIEINDIPTADISGSGIVCAGSGGTVNMTIEVTGVFDLTVTYAIDGTPQAPITISSSPYTLTASTPGTYTITNVTDANGCSNTGTGTATLTEVSAPTAVNISTDCDASNLNYVVTFEITGGDPTTYQVTGDPGNLSATPPYTFTSDPIPSGDPYSFTIDDVNNCNPQTIAGSFECSCITQVGTMDLTPITGCGLEAITTTYDPSSEVNDGNDVVEFVVHTNSGTSLGTVLLTNGSPTFTFDPNSMNYGTTYYISAIMGNDNGSGGVDLNDPCVSVAQGTPVTFFEEPTAEITGSTSICTGETATLTINLTGAAPWNLVYNDGTDDININGILSSPYSFDISPLITTTYVLVSVQDQNCEGTVSGSATISINPDPTIQISPAGPFCINDPIQQLSATPPGGTWGGVANIVGEINPSTLGQGSFTVTYDYTDANGCSGSEQMTFTINNTPNASISPAGPFCENDPPQSLIGNPSGGVWGGAANPLGQIEPSLLGPGTHIATYTYTDPNNCSDEAEISIVINQLPLISILPAGPFCIMDPIQTLSATPSGGVWGGAANANGQINPSSLGEGMHVVTYDYTDGNGCTNSEQSIIIINSEPTVIITPAGPFCENDPIQSLIGFPSGGIWGGVANQAGQINPLALGAGTFQVSYLYTDAQGCSAEDQINIQINPIPNVTILPAGPFCESDPVQLLTAFPSGGVWSGAANAIGQIDPGQLGAGPHIATYNYTNASGCSNTQQITIFINPSPIVTIDSAGPFCEDEPIQFLQASPAGGIWGGAASSNGAFNPAVLGAGTHVVTYFYATPENCSNIDQLSITVHPVPDVNIIPAGPLCEDEPLHTLMASPPGGIWGGVANANGQIDPAALGLGTHQVTYQVTNAEGCEDFESIAIDIYALPTAAISGSGMICEGGNETFPLTFNTSGSGNVIVHYEIDGNPQQPITISSSPFVLNASTPGIYTITQVTDETGCSNTGSGMAEITGVDAPQISNFNINCNATNTEYTVTFEISGGDQGSYDISGDPGNISPNAPYIFTSNPLSSGAAYFFFISDANDCSPTSLSGSFSCDCSTNAGTMNPATITICENEPAIANHDDNEVLDGNDNLIFVLHDSNGNTLGTVFSTNDTPEFNFQPPLQYGTIYYISAVAGDDDGNGGVLLDDPCLSVSLGTPVLFNPLPTATILNDASICSGDEISLVFNLTGNAPFDVTYHDGTSSILLENIFDGHAVAISPSSTITYEILSVADNSSPICMVQNGNAVTITVNSDVTIFQEMEICNGESAFLQGDFQTSSGLYSDTLSTIHNCDSIIVTELIVNDVDSIALNSTTCDLNSAGTFTNVFSNQNGCDSIVTQIIAYVEADSSYQFETSCDMANVGTKVQSFVNSQGCDSLHFIITAFAESDTTYFNFTTCDPDQTGTTTELFINSEGCDSLTITSTSLLASDTTYLFSDTCDPNSAGIFSSLLVNQNGCDSLVVETVDLLVSDTTYFDSETCNAQNAGTFYTLLQNQNGCDSLIVETVNLLEGDTTFLYDQTCNAQNAGVFTTILPNQGGCDSLIIETIELVFGDTTFLNSETCDPLSAGVFSNIFPNQHGCDSLVLETVELLDSDTTILFSTSCEPSQVGVFTNITTNQYGCDSTIIETVSLLQGDTTILNLDTCNPLDSGTVFNLLLNQNGCDSLVLTITTLLPPDFCGVEATVFGDQIGCEETTGEITLTVETGLAPLNYSWTNGNVSGNGTILTLNTPEIISNLQSGTYNITITASNGLETNLEVEITQIFSPQIDLQSMADFGGFDISCQGETDGGAAVEIIAGGAPPYHYAWSNGSSLSLAENLGTGWHAVTVTDANDCFAVDSIYLSEPEVFLVNFSINDLSCFNDQDGSITVDASGGVGPYLYSINGAPFQDEAIFSNLGAGSYQIVVQDANACEITEIILVNTPFEIDVELVGNEEIILGEAAEIQILANIPFDAIDSIMWFPPNEFECPDCIEQVIYPIVTSTYSVMVMGENGCMAEDDITIFVDRQRPVYIPNAFSPNGDGQNDFFQIFAGKSVSNIKSFLIFDRWGDAVFKAENFQPNDPAHGWDGKHRGEVLKSAVFVYFAEIEFVDGKVELFEGDVILMR